MKKFLRITRYYSILISREKIFLGICFLGILMGIFQILEYSPDVNNSLFFLEINFILWVIIPTLLSIFLLGFTVKQYGIPALFGYTLGTFLCLLPLPNTIQIGLGATLSPYLLFGIIPLTGIEGSVVSVILTGILIGKVNHRRGDVISILLSLLLGGVFNIFVFEPFFFILSSWLILSIKELLMLPFFLILLLLNIITPFFLFLGGRIFIPFVGRIYSSQYDMNLYNSLLSFIFFSWTGISLAFFIYQKNIKDRASSFLVSLCSFFGMGTPFILGYLFRYPFLFLISILGGFFGWLWIILFQIKSWSTAYHGAPSMLFYVDNEKVLFLTGAIVTLIVTFTLTFFALKKRHS